MIYRIVVFLVHIALAFCYNLKFEGKENIQKDRCCIYVANHRTNADPPLVVFSVRRRFSIMAKEELFRNKLFGWLIRHLGAFPVSRGKGDSEVIDVAVERLQKGENLLMFPEGTRSKDGKLGKGKGGAALIAAKSGAWIVPVGIVWEGEKLRFRKKIRVIYGKPIDTAEYSGTELDMRGVAKLRSRYMSDIKKIVYGDDEASANVSGENSEEGKE